MPLFLVTLYFALFVPAFIVDDTYHLTGLPLVWLVVGLGLLAWFHPGSEAQKRDSAGQPCDLLELDSHHDWDCGDCCCDFGCDY